MGIFSTAQDRVIRSLKTCLCELRNMVAGRTIFTQNSGSVTFNGTGTEDDPLTAQVTDSPSQVMRGLHSFDPDNTTTVTTIAHGLGAIPSWYVAFNLSALGGNYANRNITADATNIIITFVNPPTDADGTAWFAWEAML